MDMHRYGYRGAGLGLDVQHRPVSAADRAAASRLHQVGHGEALHLGFGI